MLRVRSLIGDGSRNFTECPELHILSSRKLVLAARRRVRGWPPPPPPPPTARPPPVDIGHCFDRGKVGSEAGGYSREEEEVLLSAPPPGKSAI